MGLKPICFKEYGHISLYMNENQKLRIHPNLLFREPLKTRTKMGTRFSIYRYSRIPSITGNTLSYLLFSNYPNLLKRETYLSAKLQKILAIRCNNGIYLHLSVQICFPRFAN